MPIVDPGNQLRGTLLLHNSTEASASAPASSASTATEAPTLEAHGDTTEMMQVDDEDTGVGPSGQEVITNPTEEKAEELLGDVI